MSRGRVEPTTGGVSRGWAVVAGVFCLLEALAYLGLAIAALALYHCEIPPPAIPQPNDLNSASELPPGAAVYFVYFYNPSCAEELNATHGWINEARLPTADRTWQWSIAYIVVSGAWVFSSLLLLMVGVAWCKGCCTRKFVPFLWLLVTLTVIVMDVVASVQYGLDIGDIIEEGSLLPLLSPIVTPNSPVEEYLGKVPESIAVLPSVALVLAVSRCLLLWLINVVFWLGVIVTCSCRRSSTSQQQRRPLDTPPQQRRDPGEAHDRRLAAAAAGALSPSASSTVRQDEWAWRSGGAGGGPKTNPAYQPYDEALDLNQGPVQPFGHNNSMGDDGRQSRQSQQGGSRGELRNQRPWSYLHPDQAPSSPPPDAKMDGEGWEPVMRLPRPIYSSAPIGGTSGGGYHPQNHFYHFPYTQQVEPIYPRFHEVKNIYQPAA